MLAGVGSFNAFALTCQSLGQTSSRLQMAQIAGDFLASLDPAEAPIAARFMVGKALPQGEEKRLQVSGRAVWRIVASITGGANHEDENQGEDIFAAATDFGEAIELLLRLRSFDPAPSLTLTEVFEMLAAIAQIEGRGSRRAKLNTLRELFERASTLEGKYLAKILIGEMRHGISEGLMLEAIARMANRPVTEVRRAHMLEGDLGRVVSQVRPDVNPGSAAPERLGTVSGVSGETAQTTSGQVRPDSEFNADGSPIRVPTASPVRPDSEFSADGSPTRVPTASPVRPDSEFSADGSPTRVPTASPVRPTLRRPLRPMLAQPAANIIEAFRMLGDRIAIEHKLDGARVQIHSGPAGVRIYSRRLNEITPSLPEVVDLAAPVAARDAIFDGEVIAVDASGRAIAFQELMRRFGRTRDIERMRTEQPVRLFLFDLIGLDGKLLIDRPYEERYAALSAIAGSAGLERAGRIVPASATEGQAFYARAIADGHEGVVAKALDSPYMPGVRGRGWLKIKAARTLDLVIVAADWGYGRRHGWLSNYHLAARDDRNSGFAEVGKTFKGMTDEDFRQMTERLLSLKTEEHRGTVFVRPEVVVEVAYSDIQRSLQYAAGMALRFARIIAVRSDKSPEEADTIEAVAAAFDRQLVKPIA
ncbi:MAG: ATP-dependent DNA ligase [Candidatus Binataceae bacterium]|jgi:ATP-dependent DNA ligase